jgi:hypothetical protein
MVFTAPAGDFANAPALAAVLVHDSDPCPWQQNAPCPGVAESIIPKIRPPASKKKPVQAGVEGVHGRFKIMLSAKIAQPIYSDARQTI